MTPGATPETADGMPMAKIGQIIGLMRHERYRFRPARRVHIPKKNGKLRPLGMPTWSDKLVDEVVRPSCPPGLRPLRFRKDRGGGLASPSLDGGFEEFREFCASRASRSAIRSSACSSAIRVSASSARSDTTKAASTS